MHFKVCNEVEIAPEKAWDLIADFSHVQHIHPLVEKVDQLSENETGLNAVRRCHFYNGIKVEEQIVEWNEKDMRYKIQVVKGKIPVKDMVAELIVEEISPTRSRIIGNIHVDPKYGILGQLMARFAMKPKFGTALGDLFSGTEYYMRTGRDVPENWHGPKPVITAS
ncbi:hypothetical protein NDN08_001361 [Rhodosorus marinus]|uniref:SRPBCC family protein n=1 Tax=Rhodosorus marinus TaxID=101924 RepID=A0AAV8UUB4_9RHOD|nr:hypothetical protein NDN08_001361 [Rhodosorus marinus]